MSTRTQAMTSKTPLTDAAEFYYPPADETKPLVMVVPAEFAKRMEEAARLARGGLMAALDAEEASDMARHVGNALNILTAALKPKP